MIKNNKYKIYILFVLISLTLTIILFGPENVKFTNFSWISAYDMMAHQVAWKIFSNDISVNDKRIIVRLDLNVPISNSKIDDDTKIKVIEPFINKLIENKAKIVLLSHLGKPKGRRISKFSLKLTKLAKG